MSSLFSNSLLTNLNTLSDLLDEENEGIDAE